MFSTRDPGPVWNWVGDDEQPAYTSPGQKREERISAVVKWQHTDLEIKEQ